MLHHMDICKINCLRCSMKRAVCSTLNHTFTLRGWITLFLIIIKETHKMANHYRKPICSDIALMQIYQNSSKLSKKCIQCQWGDKHIFWHKSRFFKSYMCYVLHIDQTVKSCYSFEWHVSKLQMASSIKRTSLKTAGDSLWEWHWHLSAISVYNIQIDDVYGNLTIWYPCEQIHFHPWREKKWFMWIMCDFLCITYNTPKHKINTNQLNKEISTNLLFNS